MDHPMETPDNVDMIIGEMMFCTPMSVETLLEGRCPGLQMAAKMISFFQYTTESWTIESYQAGKVFEEDNKIGESLRLRRNFRHDGAFTFLVYTGDVVVGGGGTSDSTVSASWDWYEITTESFIDLLRIWDHSLSGGKPIPIKVKRDIKEWDCQQWFSPAFEDTPATQEQLDEIKLLFLPHLLVAIEGEQLTTFPDFSI